MPITVDWYNADRTALIYTYHGRWTWQELERSVAAGHALMDTVPYNTVHIIIDVREMTLVPTDTISIMNNYRRKTLAPVNFGKLIIHGINPALHFLTSTVRRIVPQWVAHSDAVYTTSHAEIEYAIAWDSGFGPS